MTQTRKQKAKWNIMVSVASQLVALICGLVVPGVMIRAFGSEAYGATTSIAQFLAYITILEGGIGGVARAALYKPLAQMDTEKISAVVSEIRRFFRIIGLIFAAYVMILAPSFRSISNIQTMDWVTTAALVVVISISTFAQYFIGISNSVLLQAAQMSYITQAVSIIATIVNAVMVVMLVHLDASLLQVKLMSSAVYVLRPIALNLYVKKHFKLKKVPRTKERYLTQKWSGLSQHIAYFLHSNTDVVVLTLFADLRTVAVYSVYNMVTANIQNLVASCTAGMEALFGDMLAKREYRELERTITRYEMIGSVVAVILFSTTAVLIVPFVKLYTAGVTDANYEAPVFAMLMVISAVLYCLRMPYHSLVIAAGHFKQTQIAAYGEAAINIVLSVMLVNQLGLVGTAIGTIAATAFRYLYYVIYLSKNIVNRPISRFVKRACVNVVAFVASVGLGNLVTSGFEITSYLNWALCGVIVVCISGIVVAAANGLMYPNEISGIVRRFLPGKNMKI